MRKWLKTMATAFVVVGGIALFLVFEALFYSVVLAVFGAWMAWIVVAVSAALCIWIGFRVMG